MVDDRIARKDDTDHAATIKIATDGRKLVRKKNGNTFATSGGFLSCTICKKYFKNHVIYRKHLKMHSEKSFVCQICNKSFNLKHYLLAHMLIHTKNEHFQCHLCHKSFTQKGNLNQHLKFHLSKKPFNCGECGKDFYQQEHLKAHMRQHTNERPYQCEICNKSFNIKSSLQRHMNCHTGAKPFICDICKRGYTRRSVLVLHIQQVHENKKPYQCSVCQMCFSQKGNLQAHFKRKHLQPKCETKWGKEKGRRGMGKQAHKQSSKVIKKNSVKNIPNTSNGYTSISNRTKSSKVSDTNFVAKNNISNKLHTTDNPKTSGFAELNDFAPEMCVLSTNGETNDELNISVDDDLIRYLSVHDDVICNSMSDSNDSLPTFRNPYAFSNENLQDDVKILSEFDMLLGDPKGWEDILLADSEIFDPCSTSEIPCPPTKVNSESKKTCSQDAEEILPTVSSFPRYHDYACQSWNLASDNNVEKTRTSPSASKPDTTVQTLFPDKTILQPFQIKKEKEELIF